ncbi:MAG TPA: PadR family transcriptional regulator [Acidimicrobiia bacterium]|nr:PadR family transcriptional regulator [Acidimicrobiia bacterium]
MVPRSAGQDRSSQLLKGVLDMCLLSVIAEEPTYGYEMARKLEERGLGLASEGSIYPLLSRLQKQGLVDGYLVESPGGPARKYYRLAPPGRQALESWVADWQALAQGVNSVLAGGTNE